MEASKETGIVVTIIKVALHLPKKTNTTSITKTKVMKIVSFKLPIVLTMLSEVFTISPSLTSEGRVFSI